MDCMRVFITDGLWRKTLAAVRALGNAGIKVTAGESTILTPTFFSKYCNGFVRTPSPTLNPRAYVEFLLAYLERSPHDVLIPMEDTTQLLIARHYEEFSSKTRLFLAKHDKLVFMNDKWKILKHAETLGIPIPRTFQVDSLEMGMSMNRDLPYPLVVKPRVGSGSAGVEFVDRPEDLMPALERAFRAGRLPLLQERLPAAGAGLGASFLLDLRQEVRASFVHRRLREYPVGGGPSTLRESIVHDEVRAFGERLLRDLGFNGVAMVEFKVDLRDGRPKLMEVNPRFWGSLALAIHAGVNFPLLLVLTAMGEAFAPVTTYRIGHRCRWLLPGDILHFLSNPARWHMSPGFFQFVAPNLSYDIIDADDPLPVLGAVASLLPFLGSRDFRHVRTRRVRT